MEVWQCGYPICQHPGCWLANQDKSPKVPPLSKSITDAIEKSRKCNRVSGESHFTDSSLPTVKLIEVDSGIPEREPKSLPKLPKADRTPPKPVGNAQLSGRTVSPVQMILVESSKHDLSNCAYTPVYIWKPSSRLRRTRTLPEVKERPRLKTVNLSEFLPPQTASSTHRSKLAKLDDLIDENVTELSEDMIKCLLLSDLILDGNKPSDRPVVMKARDESVVNTKPHQQLNTVQLEIPISFQGNKTADNFNLMVIQNEDNDPLLLHSDNLATPPTTPVHPNRFTPRKSPRLTQTNSSFDPTETLYACGSSRPCTALSSRISDNTRYPYGNPYAARVPRIVTTNPLYHSNEEPSSNKQSLNANNFLHVYRYESREKTPSSYTTSSSKQLSPSIRIPYSPVYSEETNSNRSSGLGYYQRMDKKLLRIRTPIRTPPPTANSMTIPMVKSNISVGSIPIPELQTI